MTGTDLLFKSLADTTRQRLLGVLAKHELSVSELVEVLDQPQSTISRHLKVLREAGLLIDRRTGATVLYAARPISPTPATNEAKPGNGRIDLRDRLLEWVGHEPLDKAAHDRLQRVLLRRDHGGRGFFDTLGAKWDQLRIETYGQSFHLEALTALLPADWVVADIGTGTGYLLPMLSDRFSRVIAVEPAGAMLDAARNRPELLGAANVEFREGALSALPIRDGEVNLAITSLVLHHVPDPQAAIAELFRCLAGGGRLLIIEQTEHDNADFRERMGDQNWGFQPEALAAWLRSAGFGGLRSRPLATANGNGRHALDAPPLFVMTAEKPDDTRT